MTSVEISKKNYYVNGNEFNVVTHALYNNLKILDSVGEFERIISLINELSKINLFEFICYNSTHGGFIPINCSKSFENIFILNSKPDNRENIEKNVRSQNIQNIKFNLDAPMSSEFILFSEKFENIDYNIIEKYNPIILSSLSQKIIKQKLYKHIFELSGTNISLYIPNRLFDKFYQHFYYFLNDEILNYNNLFNLCIMVKNGGIQFEDMLLKNIHLIDRWTILDTGSTDGTIDIINKVLVGKKKGNLFQEPFINFRDSRNRLLELAGQECKYIIMLDDTYIIEGDLKEFFYEIRGEQTADSFTLYIKSDDVEYGSNRILKSDRNLKYKFKIHEVIQDNNNMNIVVPLCRSYISDGRFEYMEERTMARKELDLKLLYEEIEDDPDNSRTYYYLGQTYNLLNKYEESFNYFIQRMNHPNQGFIQEKIDAIFEAARIANFKLNKPWNECEELYLKAYELDNSRPDSLYFIGIHYFLENDKVKAFNYFKKAFEIGYPLHCQYSLKPTLSFHYLPKLLSQLCYEFNDFVLGEKCCELFLKNNKPDADSYNLVLSWYNIFVNLNKMDNFLHVKINNINNKPLLCFVADGGFDYWTGSDILVKGVGGSETYIIEMARYIQKQGIFKVIVFCKCLSFDVFENVEYIPLEHYQPFLKNYFVHTCIISRFSEYLPVAIHGKAENIYIVLHDLTPSGLVIHLDEKLKHIFCLSEWHVSYFTNLFPQCKEITVPFYYGIDFQKFKNDNIIIKEINKFIYSSFPNRGLLQLLQMWPKIIEKFPDASLHIYSDIDGKWVNSVEKLQMDQIKMLLNIYKENQSLNIYYYGWVDKKTLAEAWKTSEYWFYPCTFSETFCLTAVEAALSKTLAITNGLAALQNTVEKRGICIEGDTTTEEWQSKALNELFSIMNNKPKREKLIEMNYQWASKLSWENQANKFINEHILNKNILDKGYRTFFNNNT
jgi:hypothetical protein